jgi:glycine/D-amino acid oxidase-like deaminating enzyme
MAEEKAHVCVVGAGVLGLTAARELAARGVDVTVLDAEGAFAGASHRSFAWVNANNKPPHAYHRLNVAGMAEHDRLQDELGGHWFHRSGAVLAAFDGTPRHRAEFTAGRLSRLRTEDYPVEPVGGEDLARLEPAVHWPEELGEALYLPDEGYLDTDLFAAGLVADLADRGVTVQKGLVTHVAAGQGSAEVILDDGTTLDPDVVVIAAGAASRRFGLPVADLAAPVGPTERTHSFLGLTDPTEVDLGRVVISDRINVRPRHDRRLWVQLPPVEHRVAEGEAVLPEIRRLMEGELAELFGVAVPVATVYLSGRSLPEDGFPLVGFTDASRQVYSLVTHSGMTLSALLGRLAAEEITGRITGAEAGMLDPFRPDRPTGGEPAASTPFIGRQ